MKNTLVGSYIGEFIGTFFLVLFGVGAVCVSLVVGCYPGGLWDVSIIFGLGVSFAIYAVAVSSGGHVNPAATVAFATYRGFPWSKVPGYIISQIGGGFLGSAVLYFFYSPFIAKFEVAKQIVRGELGSELSAMAIGGGYFPNPAIVGTTPDAYSLVPLHTAFLSQMFWTGVLVFLIFVFVDAKNSGTPKANLYGLMIGLVVAVAIAIEAPLTMTNINPARDLGPRIFTWLTGWGKIAFPGPRGGWWLYTVAPIIGGLLAGWIYDHCVRQYILPPAIDATLSAQKS